jgi:hypothetical protein
VRLQQGVWACQAIAEVLFQLRETPIGRKTCFYQVKLIFMVTREPGRSLRFAFDAGAAMFVFLWCFCFCFHSVTDFVSFLSFLSLFLSVSLRHGRACLFSLFFPKSFETVRFHRKIGASNAGFVNEVFVFSDKKWGNYIGRDKSNLFFAVETGRISV